jgi:hypothetical protein
MLYGILITMADFMAEHGDIVPEKVKNKCLRKNLLRTFRWARRNRPGALPKLAKDIALLKLRVPKARHFYDLAELIEQSFRGETARRYAGLTARRRRR